MTAATPVAQGAAGASIAVDPQAELAELARSDALIPQGTESTATSTSAPRTHIPATLPTAPQDEVPSLHTAPKEAVRPVYNELSDAGALEVWRDLKEDLGLSKNSGDHDGGRNESAAPIHPINAENTMAWQTPEQRPKTATQTQFDREMDAYLLQQLVDDVKPWALGFVGVYAVGYLFKATFNLAQWRTARRRERQARYARHRRSAHHVSRDKDHG